MAQPYVLSATFKAEAGAFTGPVREAGQALKDLGATATATDGQVKAAAASEAAAVTRLKAEMDALRASYDPLYAARQRTIAQQELVDAAWDAGAISAREAGAWSDMLATKLHALSPAGQAAAQAARELADAQEAARAAAAVEAEAIQALKDRLDPLAAAQREAAATAEQWSKWAAEGKLSQAELAAGLGQLDAEVQRVRRSMDQATGSQRPWWMEANVTRNWVDVLQMLVASGGQIQYAIPAIVDAADVTKYYHDQAVRAGRAGAEMGASVAAGSREAGEAAGDIGDAAEAAGALGEAAGANETRIKAAATALGGWAVKGGVVLGVVAALAAAVAVGTAAWYSYTESVEAVGRAHEIAGHHLALSGDQLEALAVSSAAAGDISVRAAREMQAGMIASRSVGSEAMGTLIEISRDWAELTGGDVADAAQDLADKLADPKAAAEALDKQFNLLTWREKEQVTTLTELGRKSEAQALIADKLKDRIQDLHEDAVNPLTSAFETLGRVASNAWDGIGQAIDRAVKGASDATKLVEAEAELAALNKKKTRAADLPDWVYAGVNAWREDKASLDAKIAAKAAEVERLRWSAAEKAAADKSRSDAKAAYDTLRTYDQIAQRQDAILAENTRIAAGIAADPALAAAGQKQLARNTEEYADLNKVLAAGYTSVEAYRGAMAALNQTKAAGMGQAGDTWLAGEQALTEAFATNTDEIDRNRLRQTARTSALAQQTAAITDAMVANDAELAGARAIADAYGQSTAEGLRAEATARALAEAQSLGAGEAWAAAEANRQLAVDVANARTAAEQALSGFAQDTADAASLADAIALGVDEELYAQVAIQAASVTREWEAQVAALTDEALKAEELARLEAYRADLVEELTRGALEQRRQSLQAELRDMTSSLALAQAELQVAGLTGAAHSRVLALLKAENDLKQYGAAVTEEDRQAYLATALAIADANAQLEKANALKGVFDSAGRELSAAFKDAVKDGVDGFEDFADQALDIIKDLRLDIADQLVFTPVIQAIVGYSYSDMATSLGLTGSTGSSGVSGTASGQTTSSSGLLSGNSLGSASLWLADKSGSTSGLTSWLGETAYGGTPTTSFSYSPSTGYTTSSGITSGVTWGNVASAGLSGISAFMDFSEGNYISGVGNTAATILSLIPGLQWAAPIASIVGTVGEMLLGDTLADVQYPYLAGVSAINASGKLDTYSWETLDTEDDGSAEELAGSLTDGLNAILEAAGTRLDASQLGLISLGYNTTEEDARDGSNLGTGWYFSTDFAGFGTDASAVMSGYDTADDALFAGIKSLFENKQVESLSDDVATAVKTSTADTLDEYVSDLSFAANFDYVVNELYRNNTNTENSLEASAAATMSDTFDWVTEFLATTQDLKLDSGAFDAAQQYVRYFVGLDEVPDELTDTQQAWITLESTFSDANLTPLLEAVGLSAYNAADLLAAAQAEIRDEYAASLQEVKDQYDGKTWLADAQEFADWRDTELTNIETIGAGAETMAEITSAALLGLVESAGGGAAAVTELAETVPSLADELTALSDEIKQAYRDTLTTELNAASGKGYLNDLADVVDWWADTQARVGDDTEAAALAADLLSAKLQAVISSAGAGADALAELSAAAPELADEITAAADAMAAASADLAAANADLAARAYTMFGDDLAATLVSFDVSAAAERADYVAAGGDADWYDAVVAAERAATIQEYWAGLAEDQLAVAEDSRDALYDLADQMAAAGEKALELRLDDDLSTLSPWEQLTAARADYAAKRSAAFDRTLSAEDRGEAIADFIDAADVRAAEERDYWGDQLQYNDASAEIQADLLALAGQERAEVQSQTALMTAQVDSLSAIADSSAAQELTAEEIAAGLASANTTLSAMLTQLSATGASSGGVTTVGQQWTDGNGNNWTVTDTSGGIITQVDELGAVWSRHAYAEGGAVGTTGGVIANGRYNEDSVLARLANGDIVALAGGEYVIRATSVTAETAAWLDYVNDNGTLPEDGEIVGGWQAGGALDDDGWSPPAYVHRAALAEAAAPVPPPPAAPAAPQAAAANDQAVRVMTATAQALLAQVKALQAVTERQAADMAQMRRQMELLGKKLERRAS